MIALVTAACKRSLGGMADRHHRTANGPLADRPPQLPKRRRSASRMVARPPAVRVPERMMWMLWTCRPARIDEGIVQILLHVVNDSLLELRRIVGRHANEAGRSLHRRFVRAAYCVQKIPLQQPHYTVHVRLRDRPVVLSFHSGRLARCAVCDSVTNDDVVAAEPLKANDANASIEALNEFIALSTGQGRINLPHDYPYWFSATSDDP